MPSPFPVWGKAGIGADRAGANAYNSKNCIYQYLKNYSSHLMALFIFIQ